MKIIFLESAVRKINVPGHSVVGLTIWDIPGQEDIDLYSTYFKNLDAAIGKYIYILLDHKI
jgi:GTPase SAR1 family protein